MPRSLLDAAKRYFGFPVREAFSRTCPRAIFVRGEIVDATISAFSETYARLCAHSAVEPIIVFIDSIGGKVGVAFLICHIIATSPVPVYTVALGEASSSAFLVLQFGRLRFAEPSTVCAIHRTRTSLYGMSSLGAEECLALYEELHALDGKVERMLTYRGRPEEEIINMLRRGATMSASDALRLNLIDDIIVARSLEDVYEYVRAVHCKFQTARA